MKRQRLSAILSTIVFSLTIGAVSGHAATVPTGFTESLVATGISSPTAMQIAPDGRIFVCEQGGRLRVIKNGTLLTTPFLTLTVSSSGERGLLGVAFDPNFSTNQYLYVYYTATTPNVHNRISRFTANGDVAVAGSELVIFELDALTSATNHNGGALGFGADGKLYAAVGENANPSNAQSLSTVLGKILRINRDGTIPSDNPFYNSTSGKNRAIWAYGLRNPFTFAFHPMNGSFFINDVGETSREEINDGIAGANYGWPETEGSTSDPRFVGPRYAYSHSGACAITGGAFYAPTSAQFPSEYANDYFFADYCGGWIRKLDPADGNTVVTFATGLSDPVDVKVGDDGSLYYLSRGAGAVYRIGYGAAAPAITSHPTSQTIAPGASVTFSVRASGPAPLRYQWQRNGVAIAGATAPDYIIPSVVSADNGDRFRALVSNDFGNALSNEAVLTVSVNQAPVASISAPAAGTLYQGGAVINYAGTGVDQEDGSLPASAFTWWVDFHHDTHTHPFISPTTGSNSGSFTIPTTGETSANVWYRLYLTVRDSAGLSHTTQRDIFPRTARLTLATSVTGMQLRLDGQPVATPLSFDAVVGLERRIEAPTPQTVGSVTYTFASWSDGGAANHVISTPASDTTFTAVYQTTGAALIGLVQQIGRDAGTTSSATLTFPSANTAGNLIVACIRASGLNQVFTVTDSLGNQYRRAAQFNVTLDGVSLAIFYAENIRGGPNTVTVADTQSGTLRFALLEYFGIAPANSLDVTASAEGTSASPSSATVSTTVPGALLVGAVMTANPASFMPGAGYALRTSVPAAGTAKLVVEDRVQTSAGPAAAGGSLGAPDVWGVVFAAFRPGSTPEPPATPGSPNPTAGATNVTTQPSLTWTASGATSYDVFFGTSSPPSLVASNVSSSTYTPATLANSTTYYWQILARNAGGTTAGPVWSFTTAAAPAPGPIALVQQVGRDAGTTSSASLAFGSPNAAGNLIVVCVRASGLNQLFTVTDTNGNQYKQAHQFNVSLDGVSLAMYYAENIIGGANTVTVTDSQTGTLRFALLEYSGVARANALDITGAAEARSATPNSGPLSTAVGGALVVAAITIANPASATAGSGYTVRTNVPGSTNAKLVIEDGIRSTAGSFSVTATLSVSDEWGVVVAVFRPAQP